MTVGTSARSLALTAVAPFAVQLTAVALTLLSGCDPDWPGANKTVIVQGKVMLDGIPLANAQVTFFPIAPIDAPLDDLKPMSYGVTNINGKYSLRQADGSLGATTGQHTVIISKPLGDPSKQDWPADVNDAVPDFYRHHGYLKRHVMPLPGSHQMDFMLSTVDPLLSTRESTSSR